MTPRKLSALEPLNRLDFRGQRRALTRCALSDAGCIVPDNCIARKFIRIVKEMPRFERCTALRGAPERSRLSSAPHGPCHGGYVRR